MSLFAEIGPRFAEIWGRSGRWFFDVTGVTPPEC